MATAGSTTSIAAAGRLRQASHMRLVARTCRAWVAPWVAVALSGSMGLARVVDVEWRWFAVLCLGFAAAGVEAARRPAVHGQRVWQVMATPICLLVGVGGVALVSMDGWRLVGAAVGLAAVAAPSAMARRVGVSGAPGDVAVAATLGLAVGAVDLRAVAVVAAAAVVLTAGQVAARHVGRRFGTGSWLTVASLAALAWVAPHRGRFLDLLGAGPVSMVGALGWPR